MTLASISPTFEDRPLSVEIVRLKGEPGNDVIAYGGATFAQSAAASLTG
jgi:hypothetical protein